MSILNHSVAYVMYAGQEVSNNPSHQFGNWKRNQFSIEVTNPSGPVEYTIPPGGSINPFGTMTDLGLDGSSAFALSLPNSSSTYRITNTAGGFDGFRVNRSVDFSGNSVTVTLNNNALATFSSPVALTGVQVGDQVYIPSTIQGDPAGTYPFSVLNSGLWSIVSISGTTFSAVRPNGESFSGAAEVVPVTLASQVLIFSSSGVQVGDTVELVSGFSVVAQGSYTVSKVTSKWLEFASAVALPLETVVAGAAGLVCYGNSKSWVRIEADQPVVLRLNGQTGSLLKVTPSPSGAGWFDAYGPFHSLTIVNQSITNSAKVILASVE